MSLERTQRMRERLPSTIEQQDSDVQAFRAQFQIASLEPSGLMLVCPANAIPNVYSLLAIVCSLFDEHIYTREHILDVAQERNGSWVRLRASIMVPGPGLGDRYRDCHIEMHGMPIDGLVHDCFYLMGCSTYTDQPPRGVLGMRNRADLITDLARADRFRQAIQLSFERGMYAGQILGMSPPDPADEAAADAQSEITREEIIGAVTRLVNNVGQPVFGSPGLGASAALDAAEDIARAAGPPPPSVVPDGEVWRVRDFPELAHRTFSSVDAAVFAIRNTYSATGRNRVFLVPPRSSCIPSDRGPNLQNHNALSDAGTFTRAELRRATFAAAYGRQTPLDRDVTSLGASGSLGAIGQEVPPADSRAVDEPPQRLTPMPFDRPPMNNPANRQPPVDEISLDMLGLPDDNPLRRSLERAYQAMDTYLRSAPPHATVARRMRRTFQNYLRNVQENIAGAEAAYRELDPVGVENGIHAMERIIAGDFTALGGPNRSTYDPSARPRAVASVAARLRRDAYARRDAAGDRARLADPPASDQAASPTVRPASFTNAAPQDASALPTARRIRIRNQELKHGDTGKRDESAELDPGEDHPPAED